MIYEGIRVQAPQKTRPGVQSVIRQGSVQFSHSVISDSVTPWTAACQASLSFTASQSLLKLMSIEFQPSCPLMYPSSPAFNLSQHQGLFKWVSSSYQVAKTGVSTSTSVLPMNIQDWSPSEWTGWISLQFKTLSRVFSNTTVQKHQFFSTQLSLHSKSHIHTWPLEKP